MKMFFILFSFVLCFAACDSLPRTDLGFCYEKDGEKYCGSIGINKDKSEKENALVLEEKKENKSKILYTLTDKEVGILAESLEEKAKISSKAHSLSDFKDSSPFRKIKKYIEYVRMRK